MAQNQSLFLGYNYFIENHPMFNGNIEQKTVEATILKAQRQYMREPLGTNLYNAIMDQIAASGAPTGNYATLTSDWIRPALVDWVALKCIPMLSARFTNKGIVEGSSDYSGPVSLEKLQMLQSDFKESAGSLTQDLIDHLCNNSSLYPELNTNNGLDEKNPASIGYKLPIYDPRNRSRCRGNCGGCCKEGCAYRIG